MSVPNVLPLPRRAGFTVLEVMTVMVILFILVALSFQGYAAFLPRISRVRCTGNLHSLWVAADSYLQEHHTWPQIGVKGKSQQDYATEWIAVLRPYNMTPEAWVCPTTQSRSGNPDLHDPQNVRIDYLPTPFSSGQQMPFKWTNQPWFVEKFNEHGTGNLIIFPDGHVESMYEVIKRTNPTSTPPGI